MLAPLEWILLASTIKEDDELPATLESKHWPPDVF
jgi:hypothetical protein